MQARSLEECLKALEPLSIARGQLVATDGVCEVRVSVERGQVDLELIGHELPKGLAGEAAIVRAVQDSVFWDGAVYDVNPGAPWPIADDPSGRPRPRLHLGKPEATRDVCRAVLEGVAKIEPVRRRVPSLSVTATATPTSKDAKGGSPVAAKLRAALVAKNAELSLLDWARAEGLSLTDVASAFAELLDANEAKVARKQDPVASAQRAEAALKGGGFCPGLRLERAARALLAKDAARASSAFVRAGHERLSAGRVAEALDDFQQACAQDGKTLPDQGVAALEGLLIAIEAEARRQPDAKPVLDPKRVALELGRTYHALGLMNRARASLERALDESSPLPYQLELVEALAGAGQIGKALDRAEALAPRLGRSERRGLARTLAENAKGPSLERALALAGVRAESKTAKLAVGVAAVALVVAAGFGAQALAESSLVAASADAKVRLEKEGPTPELAETFQSIADRWMVVPAAGRAKEIAARMGDLAADRKWLQENKAALDWQTSTDPEAARVAMKRVVDGARTEALRVRLSEVTAALDKEAKLCRDEIDRVKNGLDANDFNGALEAARNLVEKYGCWKGQWKELRVPIRIVVERPENAIIDWDGERVSSPGKNFYLVFLPLVPGNAMLNARGEAGAGWKSDLRRIDLLSNASSSIRVNLERDPAYAAVPDKKNPTPGNDTTTPTTTNPASGGTTKPDKSPKGKISIGGATGPDPETPERNDDGEKPPERKSRFEVREVSGADIQKILGGGPVDVSPTPGYFDFLASELPRDGRLRLSVDVLTRVKDRKIWLGGVKLRLEDTVLGHVIPPREVEIEEMPERPVTMQANGRRTVNTLDKCVGKAFETAKFKSSVRDELVSMIRDFNKREGQ